MTNLTCDCCNKPITETGLAMVFFEINPLNQVTDLHVSHKGECDTWDTSRSIELDDFRDRPWARLREMVADYAWNGTQLVKLIGIAGAFDPESDPE